MNKNSKKGEKKYYGYKVNIKQVCITEYRSNE